jgi:hypothetical protein
MVWKNNRSIVPYDWALLFSLVNGDSFPMLKHFVMLQVFSLRKWLNRHLPLGIANNQRNSVVKKMINLFNRPISARDAKIFIL